MRPPSRVQSRHHLALSDTKVRGRNAVVPEAHGALFANFAFANRLCVALPDGALEVSP